MSLSPNWVKRAQSCVLCTEGDREIEINILWNLSEEFVSEITFSKNCSFNYCGDIINPKLARKKAQTRISCTNKDKEMKVNSKGKFEVKYLFTKLFS